MPLKLVSLLYLPSLHIAPKRTAAALKNLARYEHRYPLVIYSEAPWHESAFSNLGEHSFHRISNPEIVKQEGNGVSVPKYVYLAGLEIVEKLEVDYFITLETDSRVGCDGWDVVMFDEFFADKNYEPMMGGTIHVWHPYNQDMAHTMEFRRFMQRANALADDLPGAFIYGGKGSCQLEPPCGYPNGALSICKTELAREVFGYQDKLNVSLEKGQWDSELGYGIFRKFGATAYRHLVPMYCVLSLYGDLLTTENYRIDLLKNRRVVGIHQVKSEMA